MSNIKKMKTFLESNYQDEVMCTINDAFDIIFEYVKEETKEISTEETKKDVSKKAYDEMKKDEGAKLLSEEDLFGEDDLELEGETFEYKPTGEKKDGLPIYNGKWGDNEFKFRKKPEANIENLRPEMGEVLYKAYKAYGMYKGYTPVVTSGNDYEKHTGKSYHYKDAAVDLRLNDIPASVGEQIFKNLYNGLKGKYQPMIEYGTVKKENGKIVTQRTMPVGIQHPPAQDFGKIDSGRPGAPPEWPASVYVHIHVEPTNAQFSKMEKNEQERKAEAIKIAEASKKETDDKKSEETS